MHGLWALIGAGPLEVGFHLRLLSHRDPAFQAWGVRAAGNQGRVDPSIRDQVIARAPAILAMPVRLQAAIASRKLEGVDPVPILMDALLYAGDPLIPQVVWQNLHPLLESRQIDVDRRLREHGGTNLGLSAMAPRAIDRLLDSPKASPELVRSLLARTIGKDDLRELIDVLAERFRERALSPEMEKGLHAELTRLVDKLDPASRRSVAGARISDPAGVLRRSVEPEKDVGDRPHHLESR